MIVGDFVEWLGNGWPPWAAYRALMSGRLITIDKQPGIRPFRVGETWRLLMEKFLLKVAGPEAKVACGKTQLAEGVEAGDRWRHPCDAHPLGGARPRGGLGISPH